MSEIVVATTDALRAIVREEVNAALSAERQASELMTREQVAELLDIDVRTVVAWVRKRGLPGIKVGPTAWRFIRSDVIGWIRKQDMGSKSE